MQTDPLADFLTAIRNAARASKREVVMPYSRLKSYVAQDLDRYKLIVAGMSRYLFDRDTVPGAEPEDLMGLQIPALIIPGNDDSHATSAARYLGECLPGAQYWDVAVAEQSEERTRDRLLEFLGA